MSRKIFISYRKKDEPGFTKALFYQLRGAFDRDHLFYDLVSIETGQDFSEVLTDAVKQCDVLLAVIGPKWLDIRDESGVRRLDKDSDFVRIEIEAGLRLRKRVMPVLVNESHWPDVTELPPALAAFANCNYRRLANDQFDESCDLLIADIRKALDEAEALRRRQEEEDRLKREREARERKEQDEMRKAEDAEKAFADAKRLAELKRLELIGKYTPEQLRELEERTDWDEIKDSRKRADFEEHLGKYPGGRYDARCRDRIAEIDWKALGKNPARVDLVRFRDVNPNSRFDSEILLGIRGIDEASAWDAALSSDSIYGYETYLEIYEDGSNNARARERLSLLTEERDWPNARKDPSAATIRDFLTKHASGKYAKEANALLGELEAEELEWLAVASTDDPDAIKAFVDKWPNGRFNTVAIEKRLKILKARLDAAIKGGNLKALKAFAGQDTTEDLLKAAKTAIAAHPEEKAWRSAETANTVAAVASFIQNHPDGLYVGDAKKLEKKLKAGAAYKSLPESATRDQLTTFLAMHGDSEHATAVRAKLDTAPLWFAIIFWFVVLFAPTWLFFPRTMWEWTDGIVPNGIWETSPFYQAPYVYTPPPAVDAPTTAPAAVVPSNPSDLTSPLPSDPGALKVCFLQTDATSCHLIHDCWWDSSVPVCKRF